MNNPPKSKMTLRRKGKHARSDMTPDERESASLLIFESLVREPFFRRANYIASYLPAEDEVNTWPLVERAWRMKKRVFAPIVGKCRSMQFCELGPNSKLTTNRFGLLEPVGGRQFDAKRLDVVLAPLVAFDDRCNRIGMGGGYYDRAFSFLSSRSSFTKPKLIGLAFDCQRVEHIPASPWDIPLFRIITESGANS